MNRPFTVIGFSALFALMASVFMSKAMCIAVSAVCVVLLIVLIVVKRRNAFKEYCTWLAALITVSLAITAYGLTNHFSIEPIRSLSGETLNITGVIEKYESQYNKHYYVIDVQKVKNVKNELMEIRGFKTRMSSSFPIPAQEGDVIRADVTFYNYTEKFGFSSASSYAAKGIAAGCYQNNDSYVEIEKGKGNIKSGFAVLNRNIGSLLESALPKDVSALLEAMLLGNRENISTKTEESFRSGGVTHLLVVSGLHMTMVVGIIMAVLGFFKIRRIPKNIIAALFVIGFMFLTGLSVSVLRSGIMMVIMLAASSLGREADGLNSLGIAVLILCIFNPLIGGDIGFLLSVFATMGIILFTDPIKKIFLAAFSKVKSKQISKVIGYIMSGVSTGVAATITILPLQIYLFGEVSLWSPLLTFVLAVPCTFMMYIGVLSVILLAMGIPAYPVTYLCTGICRFILEIVDFAGSLRFLQLNMTQQRAILPLCGTLIIVSFLVIIKPHKIVRRLASVLCVMLFLISFLFHSIKYTDAVLVALPNEGNGSTVILIKNKSAAILSLEAYNSSLLIEALKNNGVEQIEIILVADDNTDTINTLEDILQLYTPEKIYAQKDIYVAFNANVITFDKKTEFTVFDNIDVTMDFAKSLYFNIYGTKFIIENGGKRAGNCDVLITNNTKSIANSQFTVLQTDDILIPERKTSSQYMYTCERRITYLEFFKNREMGLRGEN